MEVETAVCAKLFRGETEQVRKVIEIKKEKGNEVKGGNYMLDQSYYQKTDEIIEHYGRKAASLIPIMQDIQAEYRYLPGSVSYNDTETVCVPLPLSELTSWQP